MHEGINLHAVTTGNDIIDHDLAIDGCDTLASATAKYLLLEDRYKGRQAHFFFERLTDSSAIPKISHGPFGRLVC
jgi:hypothetical protein